MAESIRASFGLDTGPFLRATEQAERRAQTFEQKVEGLFRRTGSIRAERAIDSFAARLATGDITGGLEAIAMRMTGIGFAAAVGVGVAGTFLVKLGEDISKNQEKIKALHQLLATPAGVVAGLGGAGIQKQIADITKSMTEMVAVRESFTHKLASIVPGIDLVSNFQDVAGMINQFTAVNRLKMYFEDAAKSAERGNDITRIRIAGHEQEAKALEAVAKAQEKISEIELARASYEASVRGSKLPKEQQDALIEASNKASQREKATALDAGKLDIAAMIQAQSEKFKVTIADLAKVAPPTMTRGSGFFNRSDESFVTEGATSTGVSPQALYNARQARLVQSLRQQAEDAITKQADPVTAKRLRDRSDEEAKKITTVKESEKGGDVGAMLEQALTATTVPKLDELIEAVRGISLTNK